MLFSDIALTSRHLIVVVSVLNSLHRRKIASCKQALPYLGIKTQKCVGNSWNGNANVPG